MTDINDKTDDIALCAYIDGELPDDETRTLKARLLKEPDLARRLETLRGADSEVLQLYEAIDKRPMPKAVLEMLGQSEPETRAGNVIAFPKRSRFFSCPLPSPRVLHCLPAFLSPIFSMKAILQASIRTDSTPGQWLAAASSTCCSRKASAPRCKRWPMARGQSYY